MYILKKNKNHNHINLGGEGKGVNLEKVGNGDITSKHIYTLKNIIFYIFGREFII